MMVMLNESFKTLLRDILPNKEQVEMLEKAFVEVVNDRATTENRA